MRSYRLFIEILPPQLSSGETAGGSRGIPAPAAKDARGEQAAADTAAPEANVLKSAVKSVFKSAAESPPPLPPPPALTPGSRM
jgi:hypothetical protein